MVVNSSTIRQTFNNVWPELKFMVLSDPEYYSPTLIELSDYLHEFQLLDHRYIEHLFECEEFSIAFMSYCREERAKNYNWTDPKLNWPLGVVVGNKFNGSKLDHWVCACLTSDNGLLLIDPQDGAKWHPSKESDNIYFLLM